MVSIILSCQNHRETAVYITFKSMGRASYLIPSLMIIIRTLSIILYHQDPRALKETVYITLVINFNLPSFDDPSLLFLLRPLNLSRFHFLLFCLFHSNSFDQYATVLTFITIKHYNNVYVAGKNS